MREKCEAMSLKNGDVTLFGMVTDNSHSERAGTSTLTFDGNTTIEFVDYAEISIFT